MFARWLPVLVCLLRASSGNQDVFIAGFFPTSRANGSKLFEGGIGRGVLPAVNLALEHINDRPWVLEGHRLDVLWNNTECDAAIGMKSFFDMLHLPPVKVLLFGTACTMLTDPVAKMSKFWQLNQLSYADTHPMFTKQNYPNLFRIAPSEVSFNSPRIKLLMAFNWTRVGTLYQKDPRYELANNDLLRQLDNRSISSAVTQSVAGDIRPALLKLKERDCRIILGNFDEDLARSIFCEAYKLGMFGRKYQWVIVGMFEEQWWTVSDPTGTCTTDQLMQALEGYLATDLMPLRTSHEETISGLTSAQYQELYDAVRGNHYSRFHGYAYDGVWTLALAIKRVAADLRDSDQRSVGDFRYRDKYWGDRFRQALDDTSFQGVTGPVSFVDNERRGFIRIKQFQEGVEVTVGEYDSTRDTMDLTRRGPIRWFGKDPPRDRTLSVMERTRVSVPIYSAIASVAALGILVACSFLAINIKNRNHRYIKMSSPNLNNLIIVGCILTYTSVILLGLDSDLTSAQSLPYVCSARAWVLMSGFTLAFGSMFSKTWRVYTIFTNIKLNKKAITDHQLYAVVAILLVIDNIIMTTWQAVDPFYRSTKEFLPLPSSISEDIVIIPEIEFCKSERMTLFLSAIYVYKGLLMVIGCFLAWETRHVTIPALNDSKYIGMSVYNVVIMCVMGAAISFILAENQNASFIIIAIFIIFCTTTTLCLVFVPKLVELRRYPQGTETRIRAALQQSSKKRRESNDGDSAALLRRLQEQNQNFRKTLRERDAQLRTLMQQLGDEMGDLLRNDVHFKLRPPRIVQILRVEATGSTTDDDDLTSVVSTNSSLDEDAPLNSSDMYMADRSKTPENITVDCKKEVVLGGGVTATATAAALLGFGVEALSGANNSDDEPLPMTPVRNVSRGRGKDRCSDPKDTTALLAYSPVPKIKKSSSYLGNVLNTCSGEGPSQRCRSDGGRLASDC